MRAHQEGGDRLNARADSAAQQAVRDRQGMRWTAPLDNSAHIPDKPNPEQTVRLPISGTGKRCKETTKDSKPCPIDPRPSGLCHVHDPAVQCQAITKKGTRCTVATGGGRCDRHRDQVV